jgi:hypothetical protein
MRTMMNSGKLLLLVILLTMLAACAGTGSSTVRYSMGAGYYGGHYGGSPYGYYPPDVIIVPDDAPIAEPFSDPGMDFGMPDAGFDDFGDFDF